LKPEHDSGLQAGSMSDKADTDAYIEELLFGGVDELPALRQA
jgi:hypothetical protein